MAKDLAIILNNGGLNSAVAAALAVQRFRPVLVYAELAPGGTPAAKGAYDQQVAHFKPFREHTLAMPFFSLPEGPAPAATALRAVDPRVQAPLGPQVGRLL